MKNVQVIDGALNYALDIFSCNYVDFSAIFPNGINIEFIEDVNDRLDERLFDELMGRIWDKPIEKKMVSGIHGTLYFESIQKKRFYPNKLESDLNSSGRGWNHP